MIQHICDICQSNKNVFTYTMPMPVEQMVYGGNGTTPTIKWTSEAAPSEMDLCSICAGKVANRLMKFKCEERIGWINNDTN